jgi:hypothetical protein
MGKGPPCERRRARAGRQTGHVTELDARDADASQQRRGGERTLDDFFLTWLGGPTPPFRIFMTLFVYMNRISFDTTPTPPCHDPNPMRVSRHVVKYVTLSCPSLQRILHTLRLPHDHRVLLPFSPPFNRVQIPLTS